MYRLSLLLYLCSCYAWSGSFVIEARYGSEVSYGHGFFVKDGIIITSYHVVSQYDDINIKTSHESYSAKIIGFDEVLDIALLKSDIILPAFYDIAVCNKGDSGDIISSNGKVAGKIIVDGDANLILNAKGRRGYSGSPFVVNDKVCGVLTGYDKKTGSAIVSKITDDLVAQLSKGQERRRKDLRIYISNLTIDNARLLNLDLKNMPQGVLVTQSDNQEIKNWDIITKINGEPVKTTDEFLEIMNKIYENDEVVLEKFNTI